MIITLSDCLARNAKVLPDKEALVYRNKRLTFDELDREVDKIQALLSSAGLKKNDRCAIYMEKSIEEVTSIYGINRSGGIFIDINHLHKKPQVEHILADSGARFLFTTRQRLSQLGSLTASCPKLETIIVHGKGDIPENFSKKIISREQDPGQMSSAIPEISFTENDIAAIIYTSGSTGRPKGVVLSQKNLLAGAQSVSHYLNNTPQDRILSVLPFSFDYGLSQLTTSIYSGATCVLINYLLLNDIFKTMKTESITGLGLIPPLWLQLLQKQWSHKDFPAWKYLTNTGGRLPETAVKKLRKRLPDSRIFLMYGLTEAFRGTYLDPDQVDKRPDSIGKAIPNARIMIVNKEGKLCRPGEKGELVQAGAHVAQGYWNNPQKTAQMFRPNPFALPELQISEKVVYSGDTVYQDEQGFIYYEGRTDELIKTSGYRVSPTEIEEVIYKTGKVKHAAVFGIPDDILGQVPVAAVSLKQGAETDEKEITGFCMKTLPNYMVPKKVVVFDELPLNPTGKIDRNQVKSFICSMGKSG
ncbi:MAG: acyl-CoA ligase (AMP-forming), exosortase A system-associated [Deltaproteobacteria bacterium]|nr:acyl-CoA ligase (AMP-forming), exosortase A system-associated [Deltaproteobacteria bacterium]